MKYLFITVLIIIISSLLFIILILPIYATGEDLPTSKEGIVSLDNPLGETRDIPTLIGKIIKAVLGIVGSLA